MVNDETAKSYVMLLLIFNVAHVLRITVIAIKWAYLPSTIFEIMRKRRLTDQQVDSLFIPSTLSIVSLCVFMIAFSTK